MVDITNGMDPAQAAEKWIDDNSEKVTKWTKELNEERVKV